MTCSACSGPLAPSPELGSRAMACRSCGGVHGTMYRGDAAALVGLGLPMLTEEQSHGGELRYFDLTVLGSDGVSQVHGWYDVDWRRVVQYG